MHRTLLPEKAASFVLLANYTSLTNLKYWQKQINWNQSMNELKVREELETRGCWFADCDYKVKREWAVLMLKTVDAVSPVDWKDEIFSVYMDFHGFWPHGPRYWNKLQNVFKSSLKATNVNKNEHRWLHNITRQFLWILKMHNLYL